MSKPDLSIGERPSDAQRWISQGNARRSALGKGALYTARLTVDVTPLLRARIKVAAIAADLTVSELLRALLDREFPPENPPC